VIQQLEGELSGMRQRLTGLGLDSKGDGSAEDSASALRSKLHRAAKHIAQLVKEKQQLLELSNKLRAELKQAGIGLLTGLLTLLVHTLYSLLLLIYFIWGINTES
jgi:hypothetical protein